MSRNTDRVLAGFTTLTEEERKEAIRLLNEYLSADRMRRRVLKDDYGIRVALISADQRDCPCCGR